MDLRKLKENKKNPRVIRDGKFKKLVKSIITFPEMMNLRPIVVTDDGEILGGNMRFRAIEHILGKNNTLADTLSAIEDEQRRDYLSGYWEKMRQSMDVPVRLASELTEEQRKEFIIKDNVGFGDWDWDMLANEWDNEELLDWGMDVWQPVEFDEENLYSGNKQVVTEKHVLKVELTGEAVDRVIEITDAISKAISAYEGVRLL